VVASAVARFVAVLYDTRNSYARIRPTMHWWRFLRWAAVAAVCGLVACVVSEAQEAVIKKRIAVLNFDNPNVGTDAPSGLFGTDAGDVGKGVSIQLIQKLLRSGKYTILDRSALEELLQEQSKTDRESMDAYGMASKVGRLLSLDAMIIGAVTRYGVDDNTSGAGGGTAGMRTRKSKAFVEITAGVFNITSGEVMTQFSGKGESARAGEITILGRGHAKGGMQMLSGEFVESLFPEATRNAVERLATQIDEFAEEIPTLRAIEGRVAEVTGNTLTLTVGTRSGIHVGDRVEILRDVSPVAGSSGSGVVQPVPEHVGSAMVTEVAEEYAMAKFASEGHAQVGDRIRRVDEIRGGPH
jgi:curli biogenesis system outer membrane secretion channel CsgG